MSETGTLFIVPTPIGNLNDITQRALTVLSEVDIIAAEDTRHSQKLLQHYSIDTRMISVHEHNEAQRATQVINKLRANQDVALISDAGTPLISDPGYSLVNQCRDAGLNVVPLPGPCAAITALSGAGLPTDRFRFEGFLPVKQQARHHALEALSHETASAVFYESPRRILDTVNAIIDVLGDERKLVIAKELTKTFETFFSGTAQQCKHWLEEDDNHQRGEFVLLVGGQASASEGIPEEAVKLLTTLMNELPLKKAAAVTAQHYELKKNALYQLGLDLQDKG